MNDEQIARLLHKAPRPQAPVGMPERLQADIALPRRSESGPVNRTEPAPFIRRWFPAISFAAIFLSCILVIGVQTLQIGELKRDGETLRASAQNLEQLRLGSAEYQKLLATQQELERLRKDLAELQQLRAEVGQLRAQQQEVAKLRAENQQLLAAGGAPKQPKTDDDFFARTEDPRAKAMSIQCVNNLKQIGLSARVWANDDPYDLGRKDVLPPNFLSMSNELATPKILVCPADNARKPATSWQGFGAANVSYEFLNPNGSETNPYVLLTRCPFHGHVGLSDGSVWQGSGLGRSFNIVVIDGKQTFTPLGQPASPFE
jgi:hypothetical protein